jgi:predicted acylesterase/phospholipase RssA
VLRKKGKTALVLAGGGIMGAAYEIGCLTALDRLFAPGFSSRQFDLYVGVSAGSVIATLMANKIEPASLFRAIANDESTVFNWRRKDIYRLDARGLVTSCGQVLRNLFKILGHHRRQRWSFSLAELFTILQEQFPAGLFSLDPMCQYLYRSFLKEGIHDNFRQLDAELYIPAYDIDHGRRVVFGAEGFQDVRICQAITASCAIPYFFRPYPIAGRHYLDGSVGRVSHLDIAVERGAELIVVINPRVPMDNDQERSCLPSLSFGKCSSIADLGISFAWEQSRRIEGKEKLDLAIAHFRLEHPEVEVLLVEPGRDESLFFFQSPMSNEARHHVMNYGYQLTLAQLRDQYPVFEAAFERLQIRTTDEQLFAPPPAEITR